VAVQEQNRHVRERVNVFEMMMIEETRHKLTDHSQRLELDMQLSYYIGPTSLHLRALYASSNLLVRSHSLLRK
jgi:hypothetical protein